MSNTTGRPVGVARGWETHSRGWETHLRGWETH